MKRILSALLALGLLLVPPCGTAQMVTLRLRSGWPAPQGASAKPETVVQVRVEPARVELAAGAARDLTLVVIIQEGFHINSNKPAQDYLIPTRLELADAAGFELAKVDYPVGELKSFGFAPDEKLSVYDGTLKLRLRLRAKPETAAGAHTLRLVFHYQACNDQICLRPASREVKLTVQVPSTP